MKKQETYEIFIKNHIQDKVKSDNKIYEEVYRR